MDPLEVVQIPRQIGESIFENENFRIVETLLDPLQSLSHSVRSRRPSSARPEQEIPYIFKKPNLNLKKKLKITCKKWDQKIPLDPDLHCSR